MTTEEGGREGEREGGREGLLNVPVVCHEDIDQQIHSGLKEKITSVSVALSDDCERV